MFNSVCVCVLAVKGEEETYGLVRGQPVKVMRADSRCDNICNVIGSVSLTLHRSCLLARISMMFVGISWMWPYVSALFLSPSL